MAQNSAASASRWVLSTLFTATRTGAFAVRRSSAASWSAGVMPLTASTTNRITSASRIARRACSWTRISIGSSVSTSRPPVSTMTNRRPFHSMSPYIRARVVRARSSTIAWRLPTKRLKIVDFPTLGRPTMARTGRAASAREGMELRGAGRGRGAFVVGECRKRRRPAGRGRGRCEGLLGQLRRMRGSVGRAGDLEDTLGDVAEVLDRGRRAAGDPDDLAAVEDRSVREVRGILDLDRRLAGNADEPGQLLRVRARAATDDNHQVDRLGGLDGVLLAPDRHRADGVDDFQLVAPADHERGELLELPGRLGGLGDEREALLAGHLLLPVVLLVDHDRVRRKPEHPDDLGMVRGAEEDDRVTLVDELHELAVLLDHPGAGAVDHLD